MVCETVSRGVGFRTKIKIIAFLGSVTVVRHPGHSRNTLRRNGNYVRYVRYADDVRSRNSVKTQRVLRTASGDDNNKNPRQRRPKNRIENRDDDDDNRWEAGDKQRRQ